jgi:hypothetical protein
LNRQADKKRSTWRGRTIINCFFESSTRTRTSFELAGKRLGGDVINMSVPASWMVKGETLIDTAMTLNAMHPDVLVVRHPESGTVHLLCEKVHCVLCEKVHCAGVNAGDGSEHHAGRRQHDPQCRPAARPGHPALTTGLVTMPRGIGSMAAMFLVAPLIYRVDNRLIILFGLLLTAAAMWHMSQFSLQMSMAPVVISGLLQGFGLSCTQVPLNIIALSTLPRHILTQGTASAA